MTKENIIRMAKEARFYIKDDEAYSPSNQEDHELTEYLERFAKLVAQHEREKSLKLWMLLDDIDTADDIAKTDHDTYRRLCRNTQQKRWAVLSESEVDAAIRARGQA
jgi:hypothetical protein